MKNPSSPRTLFTADSGCPITRDKGNAPGFDRAGIVRIKDVVLYLAEWLKNNFPKMQPFTSTEEIRHDKVNLKFFLARVEIPLRLQVETQRS